MATITVWNKGKRTWDVKNADGKAVKLNPQESVEMDEAEGRRLCMGYPRDLSTTGIAGPSSSDLARQEQSLRDRTANLDRREAALKARENEGVSLDVLIKINDMQAISIADLRDFYNEHQQDKPRRGRPAKTSAEANPEDAKPETGAEAE